MGVFRVEVTDSGVGLTEDEQRNIFGEFTQFNKNELQGGGAVPIDRSDRVMLFTGLYVFRWLWARLVDFQTHYSVA